MKTKNVLLIALAILGLAMFNSPAIQAQTCDGGGSNFVDLNGDGFNDNAPDDDNDGIPNGLDEDYIKQPKDGEGYRNGSLGENKGKGIAEGKSMNMYQYAKRFQAYLGSMFQYKFGGFGSNAGSGSGICDGSGSGSGSGICDGTGPHGAQRGGK